MDGGSDAAARLVRVRVSVSQFGLYKIFVYSEALGHKSIVFCAND